MGTPVPDLVPYPMQDREVVLGPLITVEGGFASMLDLRFRDGRREAVPYSYLSRVTYDPNGAIRLQLPECIVTVSGRRLLPVQKAIATHTALAVSESETRFDDDGGTPYVEAIRIEDRKE
jgi:hypothetical protein